MNYLSFTLNFSRPKKIYNNGPIRFRMKITRVQPILSLLVLLILLNKLWRLYPTNEKWRMIKGMAKNNTFIGIHILFDTSFKFSIMIYISIIIEIVKNKI